MAGLQPVRNDMIFDDIITQIISSLIRLNDKKKKPNQFTKEIVVQFGKNKYEVNPFCLVEGITSPNEVIQWG